MRHLTRLILLTALIVGISSTAYASTYLQGAVTANSEAVDGGYVYLSCSGSNWTWAGDSATIGSDGRYSMDTSNNYYGPCSSYYSSTSFTSCTVYAYPDWWYGDPTWARSDDHTVDIDCDNAVTQDLEFNIKDKTIAVSVTAGSNPVTSGITVSCSQNESPWIYSSVSSATDGVYNVPVIAGTYTCYASCTIWNDCIYGGSPRVTVTVGTTDTVKTASLDFTIKDKTIDVTVKAGSTVITDSVSVYCSQRESPWTYGYASEPNEDNVYSIEVSTGSYYCYAYCNTWPCLYSGYPSTTVTVASTDTSVAAELEFTVMDKTLNVTVVADGDTITSGVSVYASEQGGSWAYSSTSEPTGTKYVLMAGEGRFNVSAYCSNWSNCEVAGYPTATVDLEEGDTTVDVTLTFIKNNATISGIVTDGTNGVASAGVSVYSYTVESGTADAGWSISKGVQKATVKGGSADTTMVSAWTTTDSSGAFQVRVPAGTYTVTIWPNSRQDVGSASTKATATANATTSLNITLPSKTATISFNVTDSTGEAVSNAYISGWSYSGEGGSNDWFWAQTDSTGAASVNAIEGLKYNVSSSFWSSDRNDTKCSYTAEGIQTIVASSTPQTLSFTYPMCDCAVTMNTLDASGNIVSSIYGSVNASPSTVDAGEYWYGLWGYISGGTGSIKVQSDIEYVFAPYIWDLNYVQGDDVASTCTDGAITIDFNLLSLDASISGNFVDENNETITSDQYSYINVYESKGRAFRSCDVTSTGYSCAASAGQWCLGYWVDRLSGFSSAPIGASTTCVTLASGESVTQDITLLKTGSVLVTVLNADGTGAENIQVIATPYSNKDHGMNEYQYMFGESTCMTGSDGTCSLNAGASSDGTVYYLNAYVSYFMRTEQNILTPDEIQATVIAENLVEADALIFRQPDGTSTITVTEGSATPSLILGKSVAKTVEGEEEDAAASAIANAKVDCFSTTGGSFEVTTDENGVATCPCSTTDPWKVVAHNIVASNLWMSEITDITCSAEGGTGSLTISNVATVPEGKSITITDAATQSLTIELSDGFSVFFPNGSLGDSDEQVTCNVDVTVTPFTANKRPASFYGYIVNCQDENMSAIIQLNSNATFTVPVIQEQVENVGLTMETILPVYYDDSNGAYNSIAGTMDEVNDVITYQQNHLTSFIVVGNGNLAGITGTEAGEEANEHGDDGTDVATSSAAGGCGCSINTEKPAFDYWWLTLGLVAFFGYRRVRIEAKERTKR